MYYKKKNNVNNCYKVALYIRLSKEDEKEGESESVTNQKSLLLEFVKQNGYELVDIYIDDGYTGTNFDRPNFQRMIKDIELGKINMVVTKDMSRLGRDYIGTGQYIEKYFPMHNVRYISILDGVDTFLDNSNNEIAPFKAIINDMYSRDNSKKIRAALKSMQEKGLWVGGCSPFGYIPDPNDKNHLVPKEDECEIVKRIFSLASEGKTPYYIKDLFNQEKIPTFAMIRNRIAKNNTMSQQGVWNAKTVKGILKNQLYTGDLIQNRRSRISYKVRKIVDNPKEDWIIVENAHEPLVSKEDWENIQKMLISNMTRNTKKELRLLDGLLFCYECKHRITICAPRKSDGRTYIVCNFYRMHSKMHLCTSHSYNYDDLEKKILDLMRTIFENNLDKEKIKDSVSKQHTIETQKNKITSAVSKAETELKLKKDNLDKMYIDKLEGKIDESMYERISEKIKSEASSLEDKVEFLKKQLCEYSDDDETKKVTVLVKNFLDMNEPSREIILKLINKIEIHKDKTVDIHFNFKGLNFLIS